MSSARSDPFSGAAPLFAALGDDTRLQLLSRLSATGHCSIATLTDGSKLTRQAVTKHLIVLESAGLIESARAGRERLWHLKIERLAQAQAWIAVLEHRWDQRLAKLRALVEDE